MRQHKELSGLRKALNNFKEMSLSKNAGLTGRRDSQQEIYEEYKQKKN